MHAPLLLGGGLSTYLLFIDQTVAGVVIRFTSFCLLSYLASSAAAALPQHCHFRTLLSLTLRYLARSLVPKAWLVDNPRRKPRPNRPETKCEDRIVLPTLTSAAERSTGTVMWCRVVYSKCITWMFEKPIEHDTAMVNIRCIPEIVWHGGIKTASLERTYDNLLECFDDQIHCLAVLSRYRDHAYLGTKAVL